MCAQGVQWKQDTDFSPFRIRISLFLYMNHEHIAELQLPQNDFSCKYCYEYSSNHPNSLCDREFLAHLLCHRGRYRSGLWKQGLDNSYHMDQREAELTALHRIKLFLRTKRRDLVVLLSYILIFFLTDLHESTQGNYNYCDRCTCSLYISL